jgi:hypothetical protein
MVTSILLLFFLFQVKHFYFDFLNQTQNELKFKGIYGNWLGIKHSLKHSIGTFLCVWIMLGPSSVLFSLCLGVFDLVVHYHTDYIKSKYGEKDVSQSKFWHDFGLDQFIHQLTYIIILGIILYE